MEVALPADEIPADPFIVHVDLPPSLQPTYGTTLALSTSATATVDEIKAKIAAIAGTSKAEQQLAFGSVPLVTDAQTLGVAGIASGDTLTLSEAAPYITVHLPIGLHTTYGPTVTVAAGPTDTVADLKAAVEAQTGVPADNQTLSYVPPPQAYVTIDLPPSLEATHGSTITLAVNPLTQTLADLKRKVEAQTGVPPSDATILLGAASGVLDGTTALTDESATLASLGVSSGGNVDVSLPNGPATAPAFSVQVAMPTSSQTM